MTSPIIQELNKAVTIEKLKQQILIHSGGTIFGSIHVVGISYEQSVKETIEIINMFVKEVYGEKK